MFTFQGMRGARRSLPAGGERYEGEKVEEDNNNDDNDLTTPDPMTALRHMRNNVWALNVKMQ